MLGLFKAKSTKKGRSRPEIGRAHKARWFRKMNETYWAADGSYLGQGHTRAAWRPLKPLNFATNKEKAVARNQERWMFWRQERDRRDQTRRKIRQWRNK